MVASLLNFHPQRASWYHACEASWERAELATGSVAMLIFSHFFFGRNFLGKRDLSTLPRVPSRALLETGKK